MNHSHTRLRGLGLALLFTLSACHSEHPAHTHAEDHPDPSAAAHAADHDHAQAHADAAEDTRGPHGGRLLRAAGFALEVTIAEAGVPPHYRLYASQHGQPLAASAVTARIELTRLDGEVHAFQFRAEDADTVLVGDGVVHEPHSFDVVVEATHAGQTYRWDYASYEGRTRIAPATAAAAGIEVERAGPADIVETLRLAGRVRVHPDRVAQVGARFAGLVQSVQVGAGDAVQRGQVLASVENRESLRSYSVTAPISGVVLRRHASPGSAAGEDPLFELADLSTVQVVLPVFEGDVLRVAPGQSMQIRSPGGALQASGTLDGWLPQADPATQATLAVAQVSNPAGQWRPGTAVVAELTVARHAVPLAVRREAVQRFRDVDVVFAQVGDTYEVRMLELGRKDATHVEVLGGLKAGTAYVSTQSYLIKADIEKSGASHDH